MQPVTLGVKEALFQKAVELSQVLAQTEELRAYAAAEADMLNDPEVVELRAKVDAAEWEIKALQGQPEMDGSPALTRMYLAKGKWQKHPKVVNYYRTQQELQKLLERLNEVITFPITGEQDDGDPSCGPCTG